MVATLFILQTSDFELSPLPCTPRIPWSEIFHCHRTSEHTEKHGSIRENPTYPCLSAFYFSCSSKCDKADLGWTLETHRQNDRADAARDIDLRVFAFVEPRGPAAANEPLL